MRLRRLRRAVSHLGIVPGAALLLWCAACTHEQPAPTSPPEVAAGARNLILISVDTLRADRLGAYGYDRPTSPFLDQLAAEGAVFENARSTSSWTIPAHGSMLTGLYPRRHGLRGFADMFPEDVTTLAQRLQARGFETIGHSNIWILDPGRGFDRGFDDFTLNMPKLDGIGAAPTINQRASRWLARREPGRFFLFLHYYDVHSHYRPMARYREMFAGPYEGPADGTTEQMERHRTGEVSLDAADASHLSDLYDAGIRQMDTELERFLGNLERKGLLDETLVILTSDHGEEFLDHGLFLHGANLYEETVRVPLILRGPGVPAGTRFDATASLVDVTPTAMALLGLPPPDDVDGVDLSLAWRAPELVDEERPIFFETDQWKPDSGRLRWAVVSGHTKLHAADGLDEAQQYDLAADPTERAAVSAIDENLRSMLDTYRASGRPAAAGPAMKPEIARKLRELGYVVD